MKTKLFVRQDIGEGDPIVLLHGIFGDGTQWEKIAPILSKNFRVIVVDLLGHGRSPRDENLSYSPEEHASALRESLEELGATNNLTVVGYSMGGAVALQYSAQYPENIAQLFLISTPFYLKPDEMIANQYASSAAFIKLSEVIFRAVEKLLLPNKVLYKAVPFADRSNKFHDMIGANDNKLEAEIIRRNIKQMIRQFPFTSALARVKAPITIYAGTRDTFIVQGQLYALKNIKPNMEIQRLEIVKVDHMLVQNLPKEMAKLISGHKDKLLHIGHDVGNGDVLVLLHGIESSSSYWDGVVPVLSESHRVIAFDLLGFGRSPKPLNIAYSLDDHMEWILRTLDSLGIKKFTIAGHSLGSIVALAVTAEVPGRVKSLILFSPVIVEDSVVPNKILLKQLKFVDQFSETSAVFSRTARALGDARINRYVPTIRSIENAIKNQNSKLLAKRASNVPTHFVYGEYDQLVDSEQLNRTTKIFKNARLTCLPGRFHNFPIFQPQEVIKAIDNNLSHKGKPQISNKVPPKFMHQIARLAVPILATKSLIYMVTGLLLFTNYASAVIVLSLSIYIINMGIKTIQGAFSLKNESLSYIAYFLLGLFVLVIGYGLFRHPEMTLKISIYTICVIVLINGLLRIATALFWTTNKRMRRMFILSGILMALSGMAALLGSIVSVYIIIYAIAVYLIFRGAQYGSYAIGAAIMAYIRGFNRR